MKARLFNNGRPCGLLGNENKYYGKDKEENVFKTLEIDKLI